jgi:phosphomannomutase
MITGSHNPPDYNGFKMVLGGLPFFGEDIQDLGRLAEKGDWEEGAGTSATADIMDIYIARLLQNFDGQAFRIGWDAGNGAAGPVQHRSVSTLH